MKIKDYKCTRCKGDDFVAIPIKAAHVIGIYCSFCGKWLKWANKGDKNLIKIGGHT